ncbi:hypothetical protein RCL1_009162 [Eukaryota sp. TZLM3-RCL]
MHFSAIPPPLPLFDFPSLYEQPINPPNNGTGLSMLWPPFNYIDTVSPPEPTHPVKSDLASSLAQEFANRSLTPHKVLNRVVYDCLQPPPGQPDPPKSISKLPPWYQLQDPGDITLVFESRFESGNLRRAVQVFPHEYDLILKPDTQTRGHTQWFYFKSSNLQPNTTYRLNLVNFTKQDSLYAHGMLPLIYSEQKASNENIGWHRGGFNVCYYQNNIKRKNGTYHYTLSFSITTTYSNDVLHFAHCYPYTYTQLRTYLRDLERDPNRRNRFRRRVLCFTLANNPCEMLTITSFTGDPEALKTRKGVVISARVHPGETNSSFIMKGIIDYLTGPSLDAKILRDNFVFKIIPMLNPDGVIVGNYRCHLAGHDLNRHWTEPSKKLNPTIFHAKQMIKRFCEDREVLLFLDLHGHSRKKNIFVYGCENKNNFELRLLEKVFPRLLHQNSTAFSFTDCCFKVQKSKQNSARVVVWRELGVLNSFTMEASFCGANFGKLSGYHFNTTHLQEMGKHFCDTILDYCDPDQSKVNSIKTELELIFPLKSDEDNDLVENGYESDSSEEELVVKKEKRKKTKKKKTSKKGAKKVDDDVITTISQSVCSIVSHNQTVETDSHCDLTSASIEENQISDQNFKDQCTDRSLSAGSCRSSRSFMSTFDSDFEQLSVNLSNSTEYRSINSRCRSTSTRKRSESLSRSAINESLPPRPVQSESPQSSSTFFNSRRRAQSASLIDRLRNLDDVIERPRQLNSKGVYSLEPPLQSVRSSQLGNFSQSIPNMMESSNRPFSVVVPKVFDSPVASLPPLTGSSGGFVSDDDFVERKASRDQSKKKGKVKKSKKK